MRVNFPNFSFASFELASHIFGSMPIPYVSFCLKISLLLKRRQLKTATKEATFCVFVDKSDSRVISPWPIGPRTLGPRILSPWHLKSQGPMGRGPKVRWTLGPWPLGPSDLRCQGLKVRGPKIWGPKVTWISGPRPLGPWDLGYLGPMVPQTLRAWTKGPDDVRTLRPGT